MKHLKIILDNIQSEQVDPSIISKLAAWTQAGLDNASELAGSISAAHAYEDEVTLLRLSHPNLTINVNASDYYLRFADPYVSSICATNWGDGVGTMQSNISSVTTLSAFFRGNNNIITFNELPRFSSLTTLNYAAFSGCSYMTSVDLSNISVLADNSFMSCTNLSNLGVFLPTEIGSAAFKYAGKNNLLPNIDFTNTTAIGADAFFESGFHMDITGSLSAVTSIGNQAFTRTKITGTVNLPNLTSLGNSVFDNTKITSVTNLGSVTTIPNYCFTYCTSLQTFSVTGITSIGTRAFMGSTNIQTMDFSSLQTVGSDAFRHAQNDAVFNYGPVVDMTSVRNITEIGEAAFLSSGIYGDINLPSLTSIGNMAFANTKITSVSDLGTITTLPGNLNVQHGVFRNCQSLQTVVIPSTVTAINGAPFISCGNLQWVKCLATTPPTLLTEWKRGRGDAVDIKGWGCPVYVPNDSVATYKAAQYWSDFPLIDELDAIRPLSLFTTDFPSA